jgi:hypothetical protein
MKKEKKSYRFNYVMTPTEKESLKFLMDCYRKKRGYGTTVGDILRRLVKDEVQRVLDKTKDYI